jgi:MFS family permease
LILFPGTLIGISFAGAQIGIVMVMPLAGFLCGLDFDRGWPSIFYTVGLAGILWSILWLIFAASSPQTHRTITEPERKYILESLDKTKASKTSRFWNLSMVNISGRFSVSEEKENAPNRHSPFQTRFGHFIHCLFCGHQC